VSPNRLDNLRTLRFANADTAFATAFVTLTTGVFLVGFVQHLGGRDLWIGLLSSIPSLMGLLQIPGAIWGRGFPSFKPFVLPGAVLWRVCYIPLVFLPLLPMSNELRLGLLAILVTVASAAATIPNSIYNDWLAEMVPDNSRGWFFGRRNAIATAVAAVIGIVGAVALDSMRATGREPLGFSLVFGIGMLCGLGSLVFFLMMRDVPRANPVKRNLKEGLEAIGAPFQDLAYRKVLIFLAVSTVGQAFAGNLFAAYARESLHLDFKILQGTAVFMAIGNVATAPLWGFLSDKYGNKPILTLAGYLIALNPLPWIISIPGRDTFNTVLLLGSHVLMGMFWCGVTLCQFNLMLSTANSDDRANYLAAGLTTTAVVGGVAPLLGATMMAALRNPFEPVVAYKIVFFTAVFLRIGAVFMLRPVDEPGSKKIQTALRDLSGVTPRGMRAMRSLSRTTDVAAREEAIQSVGEERITLAADEIIKALHDPLPRVRRQAAAAIANLRDPRATDELIHQLVEHPDLVEEEAIESLGTLGDPGAIPALLRTLESPRSLLRRASARALGRIGARTQGPETEAILPALVHAASDDNDPDLRRAALQALRVIGGAEGASAVVHALSDELPSVRIAAAEAVAELELHDAVPELRQALLDYDDEASAEVAYALGVVGTADDIPAILQEAKGSDSVITRRRCLLGVARLLGTEQQAYRLFLLEGMARDTALMDLLRPQLRRNQSVQAALKAYSNGDEQAALRALARAKPELRLLAEHPVPELFLVAAPAVA
jgi:HEAT repeat protein/Na+/melibiose symporter-like transporter